MLFIESTTEHTAVAAPALAEGVTGNEYAWKAASLALAHLEAGVADGFQRVSELAEFDFDNPATPEQERIFMRDFIAELALHVHDVETIESNDNTPASAYMRQVWKLGAVTVYRSVLTSDIRDGAVIPGLVRWLMVSAD